MRIATPFDPIEVGEFDNFAFDFSADMGSSIMITTSWTCALAPYQTVVDPNSQSRIISASVQTTIQKLDRGQLFPVNGWFSVARIGGMPASAAGGTYVVEATANLLDGRVLKLNSTLPCVAAGS